MSPPWQLRPIIAFNREVGLNLLARAAVGCLAQWARDQHEMRMGMVTVIHTFGGDLKWHTHVHLLVTEGGLSLDGQHWVRPYNLGWLISEAGVKKMWRYHCIMAFREAHRSGKLRWEAKSAFLKAFPCFNKLLSRLYEMTWYVHIGAALLDPSGTVRYIGRYTKEQRGRGIKGQREGGRRKDGGLKVDSLWPSAPLILDPFMVRHAGLFATRWKARYLQQARQALAREKNELARAAAKSEPAMASLLAWRQRRVAQGAADPLLCPRCHVEMQLIEVAFGSHEMIARYFEKAQRAITPFHPAWQPAPG